jgi:hypothetical protein
MCVLFVIYGLCFSFVLGDCLLASLFELALRASDSVLACLTLCKRRTTARTADTITA